MGVYVTGLDAPVVSPFNGDCNTWLTAYTSPDLEDPVVPVVRLSGVRVWNNDVIPTALTLALALALTYALWARD